MKRHASLQCSTLTLKASISSDLINRYGLNAVEMFWGLFYIGALAQEVDG
jgi:hypothetical protein